MAIVAPLPMSTTGREGYAPPLIGASPMRGPTAHPNGCRAQSKGQPPTHEARRNAEGHMAEPTIHHHEVAQLMERLQVLAEQAGGGAPDPWRAKLESWLNSVLEEDMFTAEDLLTQALGAHPKHITRQDCARLGSVMQSIGWSRVRFRAPYARRPDWHYLRPGSDSEGQR